MEVLSPPVDRVLWPTWNKGSIVGQKHPLRPRHDWSIRVRLELAETGRVGHEI